MGCCRVLVGAAGVVGPRCTEANNGALLLEDKDPRTAVDDLSDRHGSLVLVDLQCLGTAVPLQEVQAEFLVGLAHMQVVKALQCLNVFCSFWALVSWCSALCRL